MLNQPTVQSGQPVQQTQQARQSAGTAEPMVTVKKADGTMMKVPLSEIRKKKLETRNLKLPARQDFVQAKSGGETGDRDLKPKTYNLKSITDKPAPGSRLQAPGPQPPQTLAEGIEMMLAEQKRIGDIRNTRPTSPASELAGGRAKTTKVRNDEREMETGNKKLETRVGNLKSVGSTQVPGQSWAVDDHKSLLDDEFHKENLPMVIEARQKALAKVRPILSPVAYNLKPEAQKHENTENKSAISRQSSAISSDQSKLQQPKSVVSDATVGVRTKTSDRSPSSVVKPMMHDVEPPTYVGDKRSLGPVDEISSFSLADLRHLDVTPQAAGSKLKQKFETLKEESYLLYIEGVKAWRQSPLYRQYQDVLLRALTARQTVNQALMMDKEREAMKLEEWQTVVKVNQSLV